VGRKELWRTPKKLAGKKGAPKVSKYSSKINEFEVGRQRRQINNQLGAQDRPQGRDCYPKTTLKDQANHQPNDQSNIISYVSKRRTKMLCWGNRQSTWHGDSKLLTQVGHCNTPSGAISRE
jgi:hypothetical protein